MLKLIAGSMILLASVLFSSALTQRKKQDEEFVKGYIDFLNCISSELIFYRREMKEIYRKYVETHDGVFARYVEDRFINNRDKNYYPDADKVESALLKLNDMDVKTQGRFLQFCKDEADKMLSARENTTKYHESMTKKLVPLVGLVLFIIII